MLKYLRLCLYLSLLFLLLTTCDLFDSSEPKPVPPGYQYDIPWPSLADSPWPMNHGDPQSTGRSKYSGPQIGNLILRIPANQIETGIAIGKDSAIYYASSSPGYLYSVGYNGNENWKILIGNTIQSTPMIDSRGIIYVSSGLNKVLAVNPSGDVKWEYICNDFIVSLSFNIGIDGNIFFVDQSSTLNVIDSSGLLQWQLNDPRILTTSDNAPVFSPDGNTLYLQGLDVNILAVDIETKSIKWSFGNDRLLSSPLVDAQGNIYFETFRNPQLQAIFYCLNPNGGKEWTFSHYSTNTSIGNIEPTIDRNGNLYFGYDSLYSLTNSGSIRWRKALPHDFLIVSPLVCDVNGNIYLGLCKDIYDIGFASYSTNGDEIWKIFIQDERLPGASPGISENGLLFFPTFRSNHILVLK